MNYGFCTHNVRSFWSDTAFGGRQPIVRKDYAFGASAQTAAVCARAPVPLCSCALWPCALPQHSQPGQPLPKRGPLPNKIFFLNISPATSTSDSSASSTAREQMPISKAYTEKLQLFGVADW